MCGTWSKKLSTIVASAHDEAGLLEPAPARLKPATALFTFLVTFFAMVFQNCASSYFLRSFPIAAGFLSALLDVFVHALFFRPDAAQRFFLSRHSNSPFAMPTSFSLPYCWTCVCAAPAYRPLHSRSPPPADAIPSRARSRQSASELPQVGVIATKWSLSRRRSITYDAYRYGCPSMRQLGHMLRILMYRRMSCRFMMIPAAKAAIAKPAASFVMFISCAPIYIIRPEFPATASNPPHQQKND